MSEEHDPDPPQDTIYKYYKTTKRKHKESLGFMSVDRIQEERIEDLP